MKTETKNILKQKGKIDLFTEGRYQTVKQVMQYGMKKDIQLKNLLSLDVQNKAKFIADHLILFVEQGKI